MRTIKLSVVSLAAATIVVAAQCGPSGPQYRLVVMNRYTELLMFAERENERQLESR